MQRWQGGIPADAVKRDFSAAYGELAKAVLPLLPVKRRRATTAANAEGSEERPCRAENPAECRVHGTPESKEEKTQRRWQSSMKIAAERWMITWRFLQRIFTEIAEFRGTKAKSCSVQ